MTAVTRYDISLDTGTGTDRDAREAYFDQITAMSQGIINSSFRELFDAIPGTATMFYNGPRGNLDAILDAPSIMINGTTAVAQEIFYVLRIKSGNITFSSGQKLDINNWELAVKTRLSDTRLDILDTDSDRVKKRKQRWLENAAKKYPGFQPGDYSVQRVFCALGSAEWRDYDEKLSSVWDTVTNSRIKFSDWVGRSSNAVFEDDIVTIIKNWAKEQDEKETSTLGIKFALKPEDVAVNLPTFRPVYITNQVYPYVPPGKKTAETSLGEYTKDKRDAANPWGKLVDGDYNCLLYCENVDRLMGTGPEGKVSARPLPTNTALSYNGNLAEPGPPPILGSFVMDHRVFMTTFLLPQLQELCLATYMQVGVPTCWYELAVRTSWIQPNYAIGCALSGQPAIPASDAFFKLDRRNETSYRWFKTSEEDGRPLNKVFMYTVEGAPNLPVRWGNHYYRADSEVNVAWTTGSPVIEISGKTLYDYKIAFADKRDGFSYEGDGAANVSRSEYIATGTWSFSIVMRNVITDVKDKNGNFVGQTEVLRPCMEGLVDGRPGNVKVTVDTEILTEGIVGDTGKAIEDRLIDTLKRGMQVIIANIANRFEHTGKLSYPGHGELQYTNPQFTRLGSLIATVLYKKPSQGGKMFFPVIDRSKMTVTKPSLPPPETSTFAASLAHNREPALTWYLKFGYNEKTRIGRLTIRGTNSKVKTADTSIADVALAFRVIRISLVHTPHKDPVTGVTTAPKLFSEAHFEPEPDPGLMKQLFDAGKALIRKIIKVKVPAPESDSEDEAPEGAVTKPLVKQPQVSDSKVPAIKSKTTQTAHPQAPAVVSDEATSQDAPVEATVGKPPVTQTRAFHSDVAAPSSPATQAPVKETPPAEAPPAVTVNTNGHVVEPEVAIPAATIVGPEVSPGTATNTSTDATTDNTLASSLDAQSDANNTTNFSNPSTTRDVTSASTTEKAAPQVAPSPQEDTNVSSAKATATPAITQAKSSGKTATKPVSRFTPAATPAKSTDTKPKKKKKPIRYVEVDKTEETLRLAGNVYRFKPWEQDETLEKAVDESTTLVRPEITIDGQTRSIDITLYPTWGSKDRDDSEEAPKALLVPASEGFELVMQGEVPEIGNYAIKIQEEWRTIEDGATTEGAYATDYKMVEMMFVEKDGVRELECDTYDVSDRMEAEKKRKEEAEAAAAKVQVAN